MRSLNQVFLVNYIDGYCKEYHVPVDFNFTCSSWKRNWNASER